MTSKLHGLTLCLALALFSLPEGNASYQPDLRDYQQKQALNVVNSLMRMYRNPERLVRRQLNLDEEAWTGRWFPDKPTERPHTNVGENVGEIKGMNQRQQSMWSMINSTCDDGKTNLTVDWSGSPVNYTCYTPKNRIVPDPNLQALIIKDNLPTAYQARHVCMDSEIYYDSYLPTFGPHRPAWPKYGEYKFVPKQRWIHSLEHGAVVMLYHPCAHPMLVAKLKKIVSSCLYRHIITPYTLLPANRPLALVTWGWALLMSDIDTDIVTKFITDHALNGPEHLSKNGQYDHMLTKPAKVITDIDDSTVCSIHYD